MEKFKFGNTDLSIANIVFGGNVFGWTLDETGSFAILDAFVDRGFNAIDTANSYSHWVPGNTGGESETIMGKWMHERKNRDKLVIMTKVGGRFADNPAYNTTRSHIMEQVDKSLQRLKTDYIDLYQTHYDQVSTPLEETLRAYEELQQAGKIRYIGASNITPTRLQESLALSKSAGMPAYVSLQPGYNLYAREKFETEYQQLAREQQLAVIPYYALASGFLSGKYREEADFGKSARGEEVKKQYWNERGFAILKALGTLQEKHNTNASALSLAWLLHQDTIAAPIASATKEAHIDAFVEASTLKLDGEDLELLNTSSVY